MSVKKTAKGTWYTKFYYTDWKGERKQKKKEGFKTRAEALEFERDFLNKYAGSPDITFGNLIERYMLDCKARLKETTMGTKKHMIETKILPYFKDLPISKIDSLKVREWQTILINDENHYDQTYLKVIHNQMSAIMNYAVEYYNLPKNPAKKSMGKKHAEDMKFWTVDEFQTFIKTTEDDITVNTIFNLFFFSGIREGELLALTLNDFDFDKNTVSITKTYARINGKDIIQTPKTKKSNRVVSLPPNIMNKVKEYSIHLYGYKPKQRLFPYTKRNLYPWIDKHCKLSGVKRIRIHDLRHSHASLLVEKNVPIVAISERLGHEDVQTTLNTYAHLYPQKQEEIANILSAFTI